MNKINIAVITIDSLRYDVAVKTATPNFNKLFNFLNIPGWRKVYSPGTYTLLTHISIFHGGIFPDSSDINEPVYNRKNMAFFRVVLPWNLNRPTLYPTPEAPNVVKGFEKLGYRTVGIGGTTWFSSSFETSNLWRGNYFQEFYWNEIFDQYNIYSFENQIVTTKKLLSVLDRPLFYFLNISVTHSPFRLMEKKGDFTIEHQMSAFEYVDEHIIDLLNTIPKPCHFIILSDHGECFGEDGQWGHSFYHPKLWRFQWFILFCKKILIYNNLLSII